MARGRTPRSRRPGRPQYGPQGHGPQGTVWNPIEGPRLDATGRVRRSHCGAFVLGPPTPSCWCPQSGSGSWSSPTGCPLVSPRRLPPRSSTSRKPAPSTATDWPATRGCSRTTTPPRPGSVRPRRPTRPRRAQPMPMSAPTPTPTTGWPRSPRRARAGSCASAQAHRIPPEPLGRRHLRLPDQRRERQRPRGRLRRGRAGPVRHCGRP